MKESYPKDWPQFYTATIQGWKHLFREDKYNDVIINSLKQLVQTKKVRINAFVIMQNHIHIIWQAMHGHHLDNIQTSFKKHTLKEFTKLLKEDKDIGPYEVTLTDRKHHFWKRNSLGVELFTELVLIQKLQYIHRNPVKADLCIYEEDYNYSSALFYVKGVDTFGIVEHYEN